MNRNTKRRAKLELVARRKAGEKLVNPATKRRSKWHGRIASTKTRF